MGVITGLTADRMLEIEGQSVISGAVDPKGDLILRTHGGATINAGHVHGEAATALLAVQDTATIDLVLSGLGTPESPWALTGNVKNIPASATNSGVFDHARIPDLTTTAQLDPYYRGPGPARVLIPGDTALSGPFKWTVPYVPGGAREVNLRRDPASNSWVITGQGDGNKHALVLASSWKRYNDIAVVHEWAPPRVQKLSSGIVVLSGMIRVDTNAPNGMVITTLPADMRPDHDLIVGTNNSDVARYINISAGTGNVTVGESFSVSSYVTLDGIAFPAAGVAKWTYVSPNSPSTDHNFQNNWRDYNVTQFGRARFWKDPYGFVWFGGVVMGGTTTDNDAIFQLPLTHRAYKNQHMATSSYGSMGVVGARPNGIGLDIKAGNTSNGWVSLANVTLVTADAYNNNPWRTWPNMANGWVNFDPTGYQNAGELRRGDGLGFLHGMLRAGTMGTRAAYVHAESVPEMDLIIAAVSTAARGRLDMGGRINSSKILGSIQPVQGSNQWFSLDSIKYMV